MSTSTWRCHDCPQTGSNPVLAEYHAVMAGHLTYPVVTK